MIKDCFDNAVILNMSTAFERTCREAPIEIRRHEERSFIAHAHRALTTLDELTMAGMLAVEEYMSRKAA
jgi:hypothetical protein